MSRTHGADRNVRDPLTRLKFLRLWRQRSVYVRYGNQNNAVQTPDGKTAAGHDPLEFNKKARCDWTRGHARKHARKHAANTFTCSFVIKRDNENPRVGAETHSDVARGCGFREFNGRGQKSHGDVKYHEVQFRPVKNPHQHFDI